jgi:hypothetical protein
VSLQQKEFLTAARIDVGVDQRSASCCDLVAEVACRFGEARFRATGASMMPVVWPGDVLTVRSCEMTDLQPGQIALFRRSGRLVAHRVIRVDGDWLITRGDSVRHEDSPILKSDVVGQVVSVARLGVRRGRHVPSRRSLSKRSLSGRSFWNRAGSHVLQRSDFCLRAAMFVVRRLQTPDNEEISWA